MTLPNFLIVGAPKSGTTSLWEYLKQHPDVFVSQVKEPGYFSLEGPPDYRGPGDLDFKVIHERGPYEALFSEAGGRRAVGEASTYYLYSPIAARRIDEAIPDARIVAILRHPVDRAYANYMHWIRRGVETAPTFDAAVALEARRMEENYLPLWFYRAQSLYYPQLLRYYDRFGASRVRTYCYDDLVRDPVTLMRDLFRFLDVDPNVPLDTSARHNEGWAPKNPTLNRVLVRPGWVKTLAQALVPTRVRRSVTPLLMRRNRTRPEKPTATLRATHLEAFRADIVAVQELTGLNLNHWLAPAVQQPPSPGVGIRSSFDSSSGAR